MENPINQTLSNISQTLQFLVDNDFLDGVELNPGEYEEAQERDVAGTHKLVEMMETDRKPSTDVDLVFADEPVGEVKGGDSEAVQDMPKEGAQAAEEEPSRADVSVVPP